MIADIHHSFLPDLTSKMERLYIMEPLELCPSYNDNFQLRHECRYSPLILAHSHLQTGEVVYYGPLRLCPSYNDNFQLIHQCRYSSLILARSHLQNGEVVHHVTSWVMPYLQ